MESLKRLRGHIERIVAWLVAVHVDRVNRVPNLVKQCESLTISYPYFSETYIERHIEANGAEAPEAAEFRACLPTRFSRTVKCLYTLTALLGCLRALSYPLVTFYDLDLVRPQDNIQIKQNLATNQTELYFSCLISNCSLLVEAAERPETDLEQLARTLLELPLFPICHPRLSSLHNITQHFGSYGLLFTLSIALMLCLTGMILPLIQVFSSTDNLLLMFLVAPKITTRLVELRASQLVDELAESFVNFQDRLGRLRREAAPMRLGSGEDFCRLSDRRQLMLEQQLRDRSPRTAASLVGAQDFWRNNLDLVDISQDQAVRLKSARYKAEFVRDTISALRSDWWYLSARRALTTLSLGCVHSINPSAVFICFMAWQMMQCKQARIRQIGAQLTASNCSMARWDGMQNDQRAQPLELESFNFEFPYLMVFMDAQLNSWPLMAVTLFFVIFVVSNLELLCWLHEIKFNLRLGRHIIAELLVRQQALANGQLELTSARHLNSRTVREVSAPRLQLARGSLLLNDQLFDFQTMRDLFVASSSLQVVRLRCLGPGGASSRLESDLKFHKLALSIIRQQELSGEAVVVELMEKLYVSLRIFLDQVARYAPTITIMIIYIHFYDYGFVLLGIWLVRAISNFKWAPAGLILSAWLAVNVLIWFAVNLHAKGKELHGLIWSLIAVTCDSRDLRVMHMRRLWLKQIEALDMDGGLALKALNVRITYTRIIQMIVGSGTLVVFALR